MDYKLRNYYNLIVPSPLMENEYVRILAIRNDKNSKVLTKTFFIKSFEEFQDIVTKYKYNWNLYLGAATINGKDEAKIEDTCRRKVLFFDFDRKDFPQYSEMKDFTSHFKRKISTLFYHCLIDSGNGYHFVVSTELSNDIKRITKLNSQLAKYLDADLKATSPTQVMRIPTSLNLKHEKPKAVSIVTNTYGTDRHKPYKLDRIEQILRFIKNNEPENPETSDKPVIQFNEYTHYYCIEKMLAEGCDKGERNFALGRITKCLQVKGYPYDTALKKVLEWNSRCRPPKTKNEVETDFESYWRGSYKLLGCTLANESDKKILAKYCDRYSCKSIVNGETRGVVEGKEVVLNNKILKNQMMRKLTGNHYLILTVLHVNDEGLSYKQLKEEITSSTTKKPCMSDNTFRKAITDLVNSNYIKGDKKLYKLFDIPNFGAGYTRFYYAASILLINKIIKPKAYLVYLTLARNLQKGRPVTYEQLSDDLGITMGNMPDYIKELHDSHILKIEKNYTDKGYIYNRYILIA